VDREVAFQGTNYYLLPIKHCDKQGCAIKYYARDLSGGNMLLVQMLMVNEKDGSVLDRDLYLANDGVTFGTDKDGNAYLLKGGLKMTAGNPSLQITQVGEAEVQARQAQVAAEAAQTAHARALAEEQLRQQMATQNPKKRMIGTRVCQSRGIWVAIGYTEAVSPDNGKIQIRIADEQGANAPSIHPGGFQPSIIWDDPTIWELCDRATP
jgi:hypothetical protein